MSRSFKATVYYIANELAKSTGKNRSVCLARAWALYRFTKKMREGVVDFSYEKADGSLRKAKGTLAELNTPVKGTKKESYKTICYFDVEANGLRSFKVENFITTY